MEQYIIITFNSTNFAMQAEAYIKTQGVQPQIIPTPREITLSCGISIKLPGNLKGEVSKWVDSGSISVKEVFLMTGQGENRNLEKANLSKDAEY